MNPLDKIAAAVVQIEPEYPEPEENLPKIQEWLERAASTGARLIVFPEGMNARYFFRDAEDAWNRSVAVPGPFVDALAEAAGRLHVTVAIGLFTRRTAGNGENRACNEVFLFGPSGKLLGVYRKNYYIKADKRWFHMETGASRSSRRPPGWWEASSAPTPGFPRSPAVWRWKGPKSSSTAPTGAGPTSTSFTFPPGGRKTAATSWPPLGRK